MRDYNVPVPDSFPIFPKPMRSLLPILSLSILAAAASPAQGVGPIKLPPPKPLPAKVDDAAKALTDARQFRKDGEFAKALERHEWFHANALEINPGYYGMRLSFALSDWMVLASQYPPALESLKRVRDEGTKKLEDGQGDAGLFHDVITINGKLSEDAASIALFKKLDATQPELANKCFRMISTVLIDKGELELFDKQAGDPKVFLAREIDAYKLGVEKLSNDPRAKQGIEHFRQKLINVTLTLAKIATEKGNAALATELKETANKVVPDPRLK